jgi:CO/xanthine dehydrogenase Mo-binding subunit
MDPPRRRDQRHPPVERQAPFVANIDPIYDMPKRRLVLHSISTPMRTSTLRSIGNLPSVFAVESFIDDLAIAAGTDRLEFRLRHLRDQRMRDVLLAAAERAGWSHEKLPFGEGRGIGLARYGNTKTYTAAILDVRVDDATAEIGVERAVIAADAGQIVDPDGLRSQLEGGLIQAVGAALMEEVGWDAGEITSVDWETYPVLRFSRAPREVEVVLIDRPGMPFLGAGEAAPGPSVAALANAVRDALGIRLSDLPFTPERIRDALL